MSYVLTRTDLDATQCEEPGCTSDHRIIYFHPACHPDCGLDVRYDKLLCYLALLCHECGDVVARIAPADRGAPCQ
jgi:hypothetical protein